MDFLNMLGIQSAPQRMAGIRAQPRMGGPSLRQPHYLNQGQEYTGPAGWSVEPPNMSLEDPEERERILLRALLSSQGSI